MKSIIFLLLTACCLFPFSSTTFTSENPIILPTTTQDSNIVLDSDGEPLKTGEKYIIRNPLISDGAVYWGNIGGTPCTNTVMQHNSTQSNVGNWTAVQFVLSGNDDVVRKGVEINIMFSVETSNSCANETVWKVGEFQYVVTGGTLGSATKHFKIEEYDSEIPGGENAYKLMYCPPNYQCEDVCTTSTDDGYDLRLAIFPTGAPPSVFDKVKNA